MSHRKLQAKIQRIKRVLSGETIKTEMSAQQKAEMELIKARRSAASAEEEAQAVRTNLDARLRSMAVLKKQTDALEIDADNFKAIGKKYYAMDNMLAANRLQLRSIEISGTSGTVYPYCVVWWQKVEGWWGQNVRGTLKSNVSPHMRNHQIICKSSEKTLDAGSEVQFTGSSLTKGISFIEDVAEINIPKLFPIHEHVLMIDVYRTIKHWVPVAHGGDKDEKVFSCCLPLAYALKDETKWWEMLEDFEFQQDASLPFAMKVDGSARTFKFSKEIADSRRFASDVSDKGKEYFRNVELKVEIGKAEDSTDSPVIHDAKAEKAAKKFG